MEKILCASIWIDDSIERDYLPTNIQSGICICGFRHGNIRPMIAEFFTNMNKEKIEEGFLTSEGRFVDRQEGAIIAIKAKQTKENIDFLTTEELY